MRIAVVGTGGIGGVMAACLTRAGADVTPIARDPAAREALQKNGYRVTDLDGTSWQVPVSHAPVAVLPDALAADARPFEAVIVTTQAPALEEALRSAAPALAADTIVVVCQNGLPEARAAALLPGAHIVGCVVGWGASMVAPATFKRTSGGGLQLGQVDRNDDKSALDALVCTLTATGPAELTDNFPGVRWSKLAINSVTSTLGAVGGEALGPLLWKKGVRDLALEIFTEVEAVARASGVRMAKVGGTLNIGSIVLTAAERKSRLGTPSLLWKHFLMLAVGGKYRRMRSSMLYALERGRPPEIDFLNGETVRRGQALGVPTPVNRALIDRVRAIESGKEKSSMAGLLALARELTSRTGSDAG